MPDNQPTQPDWVNDVPERYGSDWPEGRRCGYVFERLGLYRDRSVTGRYCGYPTEDGQKCCLFHREGDKDADSVRSEMQQAAANRVFLSEARLSDASLHHVNLNGAKLSGAELPTANLAGARLVGASLLGADLSWATLEKANLGGADLSGANLQGASFSGARLCSADLSGADLRSADLSNANMQTAYLTDVRLIGTEILPGLDLDDVTWWAADRRPRWRKWFQIREPMLREEREAGNDYDLNACERLYRQIKRCYQEAGQYDMAGTFFVREMECKRKQLPRWSLLRPVYHVLHFLCDYFENPWRVVVIGAIVILLGAFLQGAAGVHLPANPLTGAEGPAVAGPGLTLLPSLASLRAFRHALYFSIVTFTATGYGDYVPNAGWGQTIAAAETLTGVFLMATFLVCLARKFGRA